MSAPTQSVLRNRDFVRLWAAETISQFGTQVSLLAIPLVAVILLGATPFEVALLGTVEFLPFILFSLPAGAWVDRLRRRPILIIGDLGRAACLASIPIAYVLGVLTIWQLYVVGFVIGTLTVLLRRRVPVVPAIAGRARPARRRQRQARDRPGRSPRPPALRSAAD